MSNIDLISADNPSSEMKIGSSIRYGDMMRRMLFYENVSQL